MTENCGGLELLTWKRQVKKMKPGDFVKKSKGGWYNGSLGIILSVETNSQGHTIVQVLTDGKIKNWYGKYVEVVDENA